MNSETHQPSRPGVTADVIDALLPQTQCGQCGYEDCRAYAESIVSRAADINRCPPGGEQILLGLANLLGTEPVPLDRTRAAAPAWQLARIRDADCIGCTLCIRCCPVDAIVGASKRMHTVIENQCTGCGLCIPACPVDCIELEPMSLASGECAGSGGFLSEWMRTRADLARTRHLERRRRLARDVSTGRALRAKRRRARTDVQARRAVIEAAVRRVRTRRAGLGLRR